MKPFGEILLQNSKALPPWFLLTVPTQRPRSFEDSELEKGESGWCRMDGKKGLDVGGSGRGKF